MRCILGIVSVSAILMAQPATAHSGPWLYSVPDREQAIGCFDQNHAHILANYRAEPTFKSWDADHAADPVRFDQFMAEGACQCCGNAPQWVELWSNGHVAAMRLYPFTSWPQVIVYFEP
jgi:hypothetical protein